MPCVCVELQDGEMFQIKECYHRFVDHAFIPMVLSDLNEFHDGV